MTPVHAIRRAVRLLTGPAGPGPAAALAVIAALGAFLATAGPRESTVLQNRALHQTLASSPGFGMLATADAPVTTAATTLDATRLRAVGGVLGAAVRPPLVSPQASRWAGITVPRTSVAHPVPRAVLAFPPLFETDYLSPLASHARLVSGSFPRTATTIRRGGKTVAVMQGVVTQPTAARFGLRPGSRMLLLPNSLGPAAQIELVVTGVIKPVDPASAFWTTDPQVAAPTVLDRSWLGAALIGPGELAAFPAAYPQQSLQVSWSFPLRTSGLTVTGIPALSAAMIAMAAGEAGNKAQQQTGAPLSAPPTVAAIGIGTLTTFQAGQAAVGAVDSLLTYGLFAVAVILLLACALVVTDAYEAEVALILARGGSRRQVALHIAGRSAAAAVPAIAVGVVAGLVVTPGGTTRISLILAVAATAIAAPPLVAVWRHRGSAPVARAGRVDLVTPRRSGRRLVAEAAAGAAIVGAVVALRLRGAAPGSSDPYVSLAPVLVAVAAGLVAARIYPLPLRLLLRVTAPRRSPVGFLGIARAARSRSAVLLPGLALVVALAVIALGGTLRSAVSRGQVAASWRQVGADAVIRAKGAQQDIGPVPQHAVAAVPGVTHIAAIFAVAPNDPMDAIVLTNSGASVSAGVLIVDPAQYATLVAATPYPAFPARLLARPAGGGAVPVIAAPQVAAALKKGAGQVDFASSQLTVRLAATTTQTPGLPDGGPFLILPSWAARSLKAASPPNVLLATGPDINVRDLRAALARTMPASDLTSRQAVLTAKTQLPAVQGANTAFELCVAASLAVSVAAVLLGLLLSGRDRTRVAAWLSALGMTGRQARRLAMLDALPLALIAVLGAEVAGSVLAQTIAPALDLSVFTGSSAAVPVRPDLLSMTVPAAAAIVLVVVITAVQNALTRRRTKTGVLRLDEGR